MTTPAEQRLIDALKGCAYVKKLGDNKTAPVKKWYGQWPRVKIEDFEEFTRGGI
jgi:hypothetical protein